jgi:hypothetical protein
MAFKDKDEFLDALYEHLDLDPENEEDNTFFDHLGSFFDQFTEGGNTEKKNPPRRRSTQSQGSGTPRRRRRQTSNSGGFGSSAWFGQ